MCLQERCQDVKWCLPGSSRWVSLLNGDTRLALDQRHFKTILWCSSYWREIHAETRTHTIYMTIEGLKAHNFWSTRLNNLQDFPHCVVFYISLTTFPPLSSMSLSADHLFLRPHTSKPPPTPTPSPPPLYFDTLAILVTLCEDWGFSNPSTWGQPPWISVWNLGEFEFASCDMVRVMQSTSSQPIHMGSTFINPGWGRWR